MSFTFLPRSAAAILAALVIFSCQALSSRALAQADDDDPEVRIQRLENQLRQLTGQNEELQYRNRQLEERLRQLQSAAPAGAPPAQPRAAGPAPVQANPAYGQPQQAYPQQQPGYAQPQVAAPAPIVQEPAVAGRGRRGDAFDPSQNPSAPGAPQALGGGPLPLQPGGQPATRPAGESANLSNAAGGRYPQ